MERGAALRVSPRQPGTRAASGSPGGTMAARAERADGGRLKQPSTKSAGPGDRKEPSVERREARRPASFAGGLRRSAVRLDREAGHGCGASAPAPVGAPPPLAGATRDRRPHAVNNRGSGALAV